ncbi:peptidase [Methylomonas sp. LW13]|uniref:type II toxin-antitoxin system RelE/ParE family toxin n=1 Tax=unclassified Methylomonas TaxID=2608980 RepID=UPI00051C3B90|nr:type II toxin-antitoxin system RelE/ParE family toxin [Methylomonas sp. LW13]QBC28842.1 peptidase [Methylomonas sp. LW13]
MIKSFRHKGIQQFFEAGSKSGINAEHALKLSRQLLLLNAAKTPQEMDVAGWKLHPLKGDLVEHWTVKVSGNWRLTFMFEGEDVVLVDYQDYH